MVDSSASGCSCNSESALGNENRETLSERTGMLLPQLNRVRPICLPVLLFLVLGLPRSLALQPQPTADQIRALNPNVFAEAAREERVQKLANNVRLRIMAANGRSSADWRQISNRTQWEQYAREKLRLLDASL